MPLQIASNLTLPNEAVTQTFAILAKRGAGKTYTAAVMAEEMLAANLPAVICDPIGVWWGLRAGADGKSPGLPIVVFGGDHGDVPLDAGAGETLARLIAEERLSCVVDLSRFRKGEQTHFMTQFAERLYHSNRHPLHLFLDEADAFAPQRPMPGEQRLLGALEDIVRRGRARGLGCTLITQRAAVLNKNVLTQIEVLVCLRTIAPQDREAIDAWIHVHGTVEQKARLAASLPSLPIGTAWFWSPGWLDMFQQVQIRKRKTFDSSATPAVGSAAVQPKQLAQVDLAKVSQRLEAAIAQAKADDPRELRRRIAQLETELKRTPPIDPAALERAREEGREEIRESIRFFASKISSYIPAPTKTIKFFDDKPPMQPRTDEAARPATARRYNAGSGSAVAPAPAGQPMPQMHRAMLTALAQHPEGLTKGQILLHTSYASSGPVSKAFAELARNGWTNGDRAKLTITGAGVKALGSYEPLPTGDALREQLLSGNKLSVMERALFRVICDEYPDAIAKGEILRKAQYASSGPVSRAFARLVKYGYVIQSGRGELRAAREMFS